MTFLNHQSAQVFRWDLGDCTKNGISSKTGTLTIFVESERLGLRDAKGFPDTKETKEKLLELLQRHPEYENSLVAIEDECCSSRRVRGIQIKDYLAGRWTMFGGNFLWSCDSRFFEHPVKIHDRVE
jgi:hypothetical protein